MTKVLVVAWVISTLITVAPAWCDDSNASVYQESASTNGGFLHGEFVGIKPQVGVTSFTDNLGNSDVRAVYGVGLDVNLIPLQDAYFGISSGLFFANTGGAGANFFGGGSASLPTNLAWIPADLKVGINLGTAFRLSVHGGVNLIRRSDAATVALGASPAPGVTSADLSLYPNVGADIEMALARNIGLLLRPDLTLIGSGMEVWTGTFGVNIMLG